jgi:hypothetical protein
LCTRVLEPGLAGSDGCRWENPDGEPQLPTGASHGHHPFSETTTATPEQFIDRLTDLGPVRSEIFGNSAGTTELNAVIARQGKNLKGRLLAIVLGTVDKASAMMSASSAPG